ncbi:ATP:cob(I)alamin adenosyltransferase [Candidatus Shapirobacteria bacterium CG_4_9_14_3_um_filter_36_12]|uniref:Corrinoid adenosyltransferase n=1 Tax=Candidatus Shapirobacteria bacterium CG_4_9_14_3_um_filter_36_12 TaxID=1974877 RepID=A0A2M7XMN2_9BACT|nr:MAG: ATP:cob(I)alamin adenosyltransferase [Candidatus Shapirobacteria bacterium CG_4_9_14_3_um_filter_36_12]
MSITTKTGDKGYTSVAGRRVKKDSKIIEAIGTIDELQAIIEEVEIQKDLYEIMGAIACGNKITNYELRITNLENEIEKLEKKLKPVTKFLIFKKEKARKLNWVRTVVRRAERRVVALENLEFKILNLKTIIVYLNRLSDYFYLLSRQEE